MSIYDPIPSNASREVIERAAVNYAKSIDFMNGDYLDELIDDLGGKIEYKNFRGDSKFSESIHVRSQGDFTIYIPQDTSVRRDRFTIAHELAHYLLHYPALCDVHRADDAEIEMRATRFLPEEGDHNYNDLKLCEWEANWFAASFLMPEQDFKKVWKEAEALDNDPIEETSNIFRITHSTAKIRAESLKLL